MSGIEQGLVELAQAAGDWWALEIVTAAAWHHSTRPGCLGFTIATNGRASCGNCGWSVRALLSDPQLGLLALGRIGQTLAIAQQVAEVFVDIEWPGKRDRISNVRINGTGGFEYSLQLDACLKQVTLTHRIEL